MTSNLKDVSLYELALASEQPPQPLKISPSTFKAMIETVMNTLIHHQISATMWVKLPRGRAWQDILDHYCRAVDTPPNLYILKRQTSESGSFQSVKSDKSGVSAVTSDRFPSTSAYPTPSARAEHPSILSDEDDDEDSSPLDTHAGMIGSALPLISDSRLRREYFVLVMAPEFRALLLAHRPRSARQASAESSGSSAVNATLNRSSGLADDEPERKNPLLGICCFDPTTLQNVLGGIQQALQASRDNGNRTPRLVSLLERWTEQDDLLAHGTLDLTLLNSLWSRQTQLQEDLYNSSTSGRRQAEKASSLQLENAELLNAIRLKNEFLQSVGQELRTPLSAMKTALTLLESPNIRPPQRQRYMDLLKQECDRQGALIASVLDLLQLETFEEQSTMQPLRMIDLVPGVVSTYQPLAQEKGVMLAYTIPEDLPAVSCLSSWLRQIVINLLHNGIKFTQNGGQVWVRGRAQGDYVQLEFRDTGIGIAPVDIPRIFDRFYRVRQSPAIQEVGGAGLGLSIVQQLLLRCGGSISVQSRQGEGAVFNVLLPVYR